MAYERALRRYDSELFLDYNLDGVLCVFRHNKRYLPVIDSPEIKLLSLTPSRDYVCAITDTWGVSGKPCDYGIDDVLLHIQKIDSLANARLIEEMDEQNAKVDETARKDLRNEMEGMLAYERRRFAKAMDEIAPISGGMSKDEPKKRLKDRSIKNGNY